MNKIAYEIYFFLRPDKQGIAYMACQNKIGAEWLMSTSHCLVYLYLFGYLIVLYVLLLFVRLIVCICTP